MKTRTFTALVLTLCLTVCGSAGAKKTKAEKQGWKLSMQSYTFHLFSVVESLEKTRSLGLKYIEICPGQKMGEGFGDAVFDYNLTAEQQERLKNLARAKGVKIVSSGVWTPQSDEWVKIFAFAKSMGMKYISAEPARDDWDTVEKYAKQYRVGVSVHNHPDNASYWEPEVLLPFISTHSRLLGSCADVGHFKRMGLDATESLRKLSGRINSLHFKDVAPQENKEELSDVVWGTGVLNLTSMIEELKRQGFKGYFTIEYEANWENNLPKIRKSIENFNRVANEVLE